MSSNDGPGNREVAYRPFAAEFDDATLSYSESDEERAPNYVVTPTGLRANRVFAVGVLTEVERVNDDVLRGRIVDPTGAFVTYAGQYQPEAAAFLDRANPPAFVALTGKARTFEPEDSDVVYTSVRPESINAVDAGTRDRWVVSAAETTLERVAIFADALAMDARGDELRERLLTAGVPESLAAGIPIAIDHYGTTSTYLEAVRRLAVDALELVAGERESVRSLDVAPGEGGDAELGPLPGAGSILTAAAAADATEADATEADTAEVDAGAATDTAADAASASAEDATAGAAESAPSEASAESAGERTADAEADPAADTAAAAESEPAAESDSATEPEPESTVRATADASASGESSVGIDSPDDSAAGSAAGATDESEAMGSTASADDDIGDFDAGGSDDLGEFSDDADELGDFDADESAEAGADATGTADAGDSAGEEAVDADGEMYEFDEEERREIEEQYGTEFTTGADVEAPGEADIDVPSEADEGAGTTDEGATAAEPAAESSAGDAAETAGADADTPETADTGAESGAAGADAAEPTTEDDGGDEAVAPENVDVESEAVRAMDELDDGDGAERDAVVEAIVEEFGVEAEAVEDAIESALMSGRCYEPREDRLKAI